MIVGCNSCGTKFRLPDDKMTPGGVKVRCSRCKTVFVANATNTIAAPAPPPAFPQSPPSGYAPTAMSTAAADLSIPPPGAPPPGVPVARSVPPSALTHPMTPSHGVADTVMRPAAPPPHAPGPPSLLFPEAAGGMQATLHTPHHPAPPSVPPPHPHSRTAPGAPPSMTAPGGRPPMPSHPSMPPGHGVAPPRHPSMVPTGQLSVPPPMPGQHMPSMPPGRPPLPRGPASQVAPPPLPPSNASGLFGPGPVAGANPPSFAPDTGLFGAVDTNTGAPDEDPFAGLEENTSGGFGGGLLDNGRFGPESIPQSQPPGMEALDLNLSEPPGGFGGHPGSGAPRRSDSLVTGEIHFDDLAPSAPVGAPSHAPAPEEESGSLLGDLVLDDDGLIPEARMPSGLDLDLDLNGAPRDHGAGIMTSQPAAVSLPPPDVLGGGTPSAAPRDGSTLGRINLRRARLGPDGKPLEEDVAAAKARAEQLVADQAFRGAGPGGRMRAALVACVVVGALAMVLGGITGGDVSRIDRVWTLIGTKVELRTPKALPDLRSTEMRVVTYPTKTKPLLVVTGKVKNDAERAYRGVEAIALVLSGDEVVTQGRSLIGVALDPRTLSRLDGPQALETAVAQAKARARPRPNDRYLSPGESIDFMVVLPSVPEPLADHGFRVEFRESPRKAQAQKVDEGAEPDIAGQ